jgi:hypothetical protein
MIERWCDLNGPRMRVCARDEALLAPLDATWLRMATDAAGRTDYTLTISRGEVLPAPDDATLLFDGILPDKLPCVITKVGSDEHYRVEDRISLLLSKREARIVVAPGSENLVRRGLTTLAVGAALATGEQYLLHAAALALPGRDEAILIFGPSGHGKTTTSLSLLPAGFRLLTDDTCVIKREAGRDHAWALPRALKVHRKTAELLPWIRPALTGIWDEEDEQGLTPAALAGLGSVAPSRPHPIRAIVVLGKRSSGDHEFRSLPKAEMLARIASDNIARNLGGVAPGQNLRLERIAELVSANPAFELRAGSELGTLPAVLSTGLAR